MFETDTFSDEQCLDVASLPYMAPIRLLLTLEGGKGGFGAMLRSTTSRVFKKTTNFDMCRDLHGRRLAEANAEQKIAEWEANEKARLEKERADRAAERVAKERALAEAVQERIDTGYGE